MTEVMYITFKTRSEKIRQLPSGTLGTLVLGTLVFGMLILKTYQPCHEKPKPHNEAISRNPGQQP